MIILCMNSYEASTHICIWGYKGADGVVHDRGSLAEFSSFASHVTACQRQAAAPVTEKATLSSRLSKSDCQPE